MSAFHIDNGQPAKPQSDATAAIEAFIIRSPVVERIGHGLERGTMDRGVLVRLENTAYAAHGLSSYPDRRRGRAFPPESRINFVVLSNHRIDGKLIVHTAGGVKP